MLKYGNKDGFKWLRVILVIISIGAARATYVRDYKIGKVDVTPKNKLTLIVEFVS